MITSRPTVGMSGPSEVRARIADIQARLAGLGAGPGNRGGGVAGQAPMGGSGATSGPSSTLPAAATPVAGTAPLPSTTVVSRPTAGWEQRLPEAGAAWSDEITTAAEAHGIRPELLAALVWTESGFRADAVSPAGARGLGQLMPGTAAELGVDPDVPAENLDGAARYLRAQLDRFGDTRLALAAYNAGPGRVADAAGVPDIRETRDYVERVTERARLLGAPS
jgi:soluble lytic murein transglycosylase-like protein